MEPSRAEGSPAFSLTISSALPAPCRCPSQAPATTWACRQCHPHHGVQILSLCAATFPCPRRRRGSDPRTGESAGTDTTGNSLVIFQGSCRLIFKIFFNKRPKNSLWHLLCSFQGPHSIPIHVPSNVRPGSFRRHQEVGPGASQVSHQRNGTKCLRFALANKKEVILK